MRMIGLMGLDNDGKTIYTPSGKRIMKLPRSMARKIQALQHWVAKKTWKFNPS